ncbi:hypothetical protein KGA66_20630 [Actinocrinis puniceicyclus]|uniref:Uncharacterized protein n=1 Tax=Actinocrinis puniceicyclus TaxID=977794 RepID=A0A8J8BEE9_9ACTN|nr:hypothetical protein [Actinocrinis puniceicyclus]MBS2965470.1 hypothetical protein [Actinocrinis puniceicyclus]
MSTEGDDELGRPRYQPPAGAVPAAGHRGIPPAPGSVRKTAPAAVVAMAFATVGWLLPVLGGLMAVRRARAALHQIEASGGALDGMPLAVWARRLGWLYVIVWSAVLLYLALHIYIDITNVMVTVK